MTLRRPIVMAAVVTLALVVVWSNVAWLRQFERLVVAVMLWGMFMMGAVAGWALMKGLDGRPERDSGVTVDDVAKGDNDE